MITNDLVPYLYEYETHFVIHRKPFNDPARESLCIDRVHGAVMWRRDDEETSQVRSLCFADRRQAEVVVNAIILALSNGYYHRQQEQARGNS